MKKRVLIPLCILFALVAVQATAGNSDWEHLPGYFDLSQIEAFSGAEAKVEVLVKEPLLSIARAVFEKEDPEAAEMLSKIKLVSVKIFDMDDANKSKLKTDIKQIDFAIAVTVGLKSDQIRAREGSRGRRGGRN